MNIQHATKRYESWLAEQITLIPADLERKHQQMADAVFPFLRATFYRWAQRWPTVCPDLAAAPKILAVGDLHIENFGSWRDREGRLVWGVNDFDEAYPLAYTNDLVRLATSAHLAATTNSLAIAPQEACTALLSGYSEGLVASGRPFVLAEDHEWLRELNNNSLRDPAAFWQKLNALETSKESIPSHVQEILAKLLPEPSLPYRFVHRIAGLGSLGRQRWVALGQWQGGFIAREIKALAPSACLWLMNDRPAEANMQQKVLYQSVLNHAVRAPDPFVKVYKHWFIRRLAPDCSRIELAQLPKKGAEARLLYAMGWETANIHLGCPGAIPAVRRDLKARPAQWLHDGAVAMVRAVTEDWEEWRKHWSKKPANASSMH